MPKLPLIVGAVIMSTVLSPVEAIDVNIPGADAKIPKDAYINYQATNQAIEQDVANYVETLKSTDKANGISRNETSLCKGGLHISWRALPQYGYFRSQSIQPNPAFIPRSRHKKRI